MAAKSHLRGNPIYWDGKEWRYVKDDVPTLVIDKPCGYCRLDRTPEGHDGCLGSLPGVLNACCGHGHWNEAYVQFEKKADLRGNDAVDWFENYVTLRRE